MSDTEKAAPIEPAQTTTSTVADNAPHHGMSAGKYLATRFSSLQPPMNKAPNPIRLLSMVTRRQWAFFAVAFIGWVRSQQPTPWMIGLTLSI